MYRKNYGIPAEPPANPGFAKDNTPKIAIVILIVLAVLIATVPRGSHQLTKTTARYEYDSKGRLIRKTDPDGGVTLFAYNSRDQVVRETTPDNEIISSYDGWGNRTRVQDKSGSTKYEYDVFNRLVEVATIRGSINKKVEYEYDLGGRVAAVSIYEDRKLEYHVKYEHDIAGNIASVDDGNGRVAYEYFPEKGEAIRVLPNGIKTTAVFSTKDELIDLKHTRPGNILVAAYHNEYDSEGRLTSFSEQVGQSQEKPKVTKLTWDGDRLVEKLLPNGETVNYDYDDQGRRAAKQEADARISSKYDDFGKLAEEGDARFRWDENGNLAEKQTPDGRVLFEYERRGLPTVIETPEQQIQLAWGSDGDILSRKIEGGKTTHYLSDALAPSGSVLAEYSDQGAIEAAYLYGSNSMLLGARDKNGENRYFLEDGLGSVRQTVDLSGGVADFEPQGKSSLLERNLDIAGDDTVQWMIDQVTNKISSEGFATVYANKGSSFYTYKGPVYGPLYEQRYRAIGSGIGSTFATGVSGGVAIGDFWSDLKTSDEMIMAQGLPSYRENELFSENFGRKGLSFFLRAVAGAYTWQAGPVASYGASITAGQVADVMSDTAAAFGRFIGVRVDRDPGTWLMSYDQYTNYLNGKNATGAGRDPRLAIGQVPVQLDYDYRKPVMPPDLPNGGSGGVAVNPFGPNGTLSDPLKGFDSDGDFEKEAGRMVGPLVDPGGIDLSIEPKYRPDVNLADLEGAVKSALSDPNAAPVFDVTYEGRKLKGMVLPLNKAGRDTWKKWMNSKNGSAYALNRDRKPGKVRDRHGNTVEFGYDSAGKLNSTGLRTRAGSRAKAERLKDGSRLTFSDNGHTVVRRFGPAGYLSQLTVDGKLHVAIDYDEGSREATMRYEGFEENVKYDAGGRIERYRVQPLDNAGGLEGPAREVAFQYDGSGFPTNLTTSWGLSVQLGYAGDELTTASARYKDREAQDVYENGRLAQSQSFSGKKTGYSYTPRGNISSITDSRGKASYSYDKSNRLREVRFPDGRRLEYRYSIGPEGGQSVEAVTHARSR